MRKSKQDQKKEITMLERYRKINKFRYSTFRVTNQGTADEIRLNSILAEIVLQKYKELADEVATDIDNISIDMIDVEDVVGIREQEISELIAREICGYNFGHVTSKYEQYLKCQKLDEVFSMEERRKTLDKINSEIEKLEATVSSLEEIEPVLIISQKQKLKGLLKEKQALEETLDTISLEDIQSSLFCSVRSYLQSIFNDIEERIDRIERYL